MASETGQYNGEKKTSKKATLSLIFSIVGIIIFPLPVVAIVLGHLARSECKKNSSLQGKGMALAGLVISYLYLALVVACIILFLIQLAIGIPSYTITPKPKNNSIETSQPEDGQTLRERKVAGEKTDPETIQTYIDSLNSERINLIELELSDLNKYSFLDPDDFKKYSQAAIPRLKNFTVIRDQR